MGGLSAGAFNPLPAELLSHAQAVFDAHPGFDGVIDNRAEFTGKRIWVDAHGRRIVTAASQTLPTATQFHFLGDSRTFGNGLKDDDIWLN